MKQLQTLHIHRSHDLLGNDSCDLKLEGNRVGVIKIVIVINCNLITFSEVIACNCN